MAKRVNEKDIEEINEIYVSCHNISKTAEVTGWSASTVRKYLIPGYCAAMPSVENNVIITFEEDIDKVIKDLLSNEAITIVSDEEKADLKNLWKRMKV